jgi:hypothetical protein
MRLPPTYTPTRMLAAIDRPNTPPSNRKSSVFALDVAVSAASPRKRPTQNAFTDAFSV